MTQQQLNKKIIQYDCLYMVNTADSTDTYIFNTHGNMERLKQLRKLIRRYNNKCDIYMLYRGIQQCIGHSTGDFNKYMEAMESEGE